MPQPSTTGTVTVIRTSQIRNRGRSIEIFADGEQIGKLSDGETKSFQLPPGEHVLYARIDWVETDKIGINLDVGQTVQLELGNTLRGWRFLVDCVIRFSMPEVLYLKEKQ